MLFKKYRLSIAAMTTRVVYALGAITIMILLSGCETTGKIVDVIADPDIQVGEDEDQPSTAMLNIYSSKNANPNLSGEPSPIKLTFIALNARHRFNLSDFFTIVVDKEDTLGQTFTGDVAESVLFPGQYITVGPKEIPEDSRYLAVIAEFADIENSIWRASTELKARGKEYNYLVVVEKSQIRILEAE